MKGELIICSGSLSFCRDEACLASLMSSKIGHVVTKQPCEGLSNYYFAREAAIPAVQYIVTALFLPTVWFLAVPYILLYGCYLHHEQESLLRDIGEADYIALLMMHRAGYDMKAGLEFLVKNMAVGEMALALKTKLSGPDDNVSTLETYLIYVESLLIVLR
jgi:hypothetical protein